ncbi:hypothetical protein [Lactiplantibacillus paraxiangfangensis]|uniref:hypothetical protein n=1 Tax=Lactiplantibacillus paraxiangfangensis TaxID=3076224 RepID=UPI0030C70934
MSSELSSEEKMYNEWWLGRFDNKNYKIICLFEHGKKVQTYTTANADYSDKEDAEAAFWTAGHLKVSVTSVSVDGTRFKRIKGKLRRIAND